MIKPVLLFILLSCSLLSSSTYAKASEAAQRLFEQRCATAGEKIRKTVKDVDGLFLLNLRSTDINYGQQFRFDDPYGSDYGGQAYIRSFLHAHQELSGHVARADGRASPPQNHIGYAYVEARDPTDKRRYRYTALIEQPGITDPNYSTRYFRVVLNKSPVVGSSPRYGVIYQDVSTVEDRQNWIAGSSLRIIDLDTDEVIAERVGYMMDPEQGARFGGRSPWLMAASYACPAFEGRRPFLSQPGQTLRFVEKVLLPRPKTH